MHGIVLDRTELHKPLEIVGFRELDSRLFFFIAARQIFGLAIH